MQISKRLHSVVTQVTKGNSVADIGCDHGYSSIYLIKNKISPKVIAMDINQGPLNTAKKNIKIYGVEDFIETRLSDGVNKLKANEVDTILMAGMGGNLMADMIEREIEVVSSIKELILQPQSGIYRLRKLLHKLNYEIIFENMMEEDEKYYNIIKAVKSDTRLTNEISDLEYRYGRQLLEERNPVLLKHLQVELGKRNRNLRNLENARGDSSERRGEITKEKEMMEQIIDYFQY